MGLANMLAKESRAGGDASVVDPVPAVAAPVERHVVLNIKVTCALTKPA